jgi:hypothetical protein
MKQKYKYVFFLIVFLLLSSCTKADEIFCQDHLDCYRRMLFHFEIIQKAQSEIIRHSSRPDYSQIVLWANRKEIHASEVQRIITYLLTNMKPPPKNQQPNKEYTELLINYHRIFYLSQRVKETTDAHILSELREQLDKLMQNPPKYEPQNLWKEETTPTKSDEFEELIQELFEVFPQLSDLQADRLNHGTETEMLIDLDFDETSPSSELQRRQREVMRKLLRLAESGKYPDKLQVFTKIIDLGSMMQQSNITLYDENENEKADNVRNIDDEDENIELD